MGKGKALSVRAIRTAATKAKKQNDEPGLDAIWSTAGWLVPVQGVVLTVAGVGVFESLGIAVATTLGFLFASPFVAGVLEAFIPKPNSDRLAWVTMVGLAGVGWYAAGGLVPAVALAAVGLPLFVYQHRRHSAPKAAQANHVLPPALTERLAALPGDIPESLQRRLDGALASVESLHTLHADLPDGGALWSDAITCTQRVVDRAQAALRLMALPQQSDEIGDAIGAIEGQIDGLAQQLSEAVDAAGRYVALDRDQGLEELTERAEALHALAEATEEVEDALR